MESTRKSPPENWEAVLKDSDQDAFRELVEPYTEVMLRAARRDLEFYLQQEILQESDFTPEEIVGETLLYAWEHRDVRPEKMGLRSWLLGTQHRVTRGLVNRLRSYRHDKEISLDEPVPTDPDAQDTQEWFWDWYQPEHELTWEDVIPAQQPEDMEVPLTGDREELLEDTDARHVLVLHDEFEMSLPEVAFTINRSPEAVAELLEIARAGMARRGADDEDVEHPPRD